MNEPYIKEFEEERDLVAIIAVDMSQSQFYQSGDQSKLDKALELAAILGFSAVANGDQVGLALFTDTVETFIPQNRANSICLQYYLTWSTISQHPIKQIFVIYVKH